MATLTAARKSVEARERAERDQIVRAEQNRMDRAEAAEAREINSRRMREAQDRREDEYRSAHQPPVAFELEGYRLIVWLGQSDQALRALGVRAASAAAKYITDAFMNRLFTFRTTGQMPEIANWPAHAITTADLHVAYERGIITIDKIPSADSAPTN